jgi:hypothetical protein
MSLQNWRCKRGIALTPKNLQNLQEVRRKSEADKNFGNRYTLVVLDLDNIERGMVISYTGGRNSSH